MSDCPKCDDDNPHPQRPEPKVTCNHDAPPHAEVPCEFKTLGTHWELRKEEGDCPLIRVLGEDGQPCWYRVCEVAEGETGPEEDSPSIVYDCLGRYWKLQEGKDAAGIAAAMACALEAKAAIASLPPKPSKEEVNTCIAEAIAGLPTEDTFGVPSIAGGGVVDFNGDPVAAGSKIVTLPGDLIVCLSDIDKIDCEDGCMIATMKGGTRKAFTITFDRQRAQSLNVNLGSVLPDTPADTIVAEMDTITVNFGKCERCIEVDVTYGAWIATGASGTVNLGPEISIDGGAYAISGNGGSDLWVMTNRGGENEHYDTFKIGPLSGVHTLDIRNRVRSNNMGATGELRLTTHTADAKQWDVTCCDLEA